MPDSLRLARRQLRALGRYLRRHFPPWRVPPVERDPAFDGPTLEWFLARLATARAYLEYGSGASTLLAADAGVPSVSIECDAAFARAVRQALPRGARNLVVHVPIGRTEDGGRPLWIFPTRRALRKWRRYPLAGIELLGTLPAFPDLVLIDGCFRSASALIVARAAVARGVTTHILFDDYALRPQYRAVESLLNRPEPIGRAALFRITPGIAGTEALDAGFEQALRDYS